MMWQRIFTSMKIILTVALLTSVLSGCGSQSVSSSYPLESISQDGNQWSRVYRAENQSVPEVAEELVDQREPKEISKVDPERMFLVYPDEWYHLQKDPENPNDTLIEVSSVEYVRDNYDPSFLQGYIVAEIIDELFDLLKYKHYGGSYRGYTHKDIYKPKTEYHLPNVQEKKSYPPITKQGTGTIIKRSDKPSPPSTVGSSGSITKKDGKTPGTTDQSMGKITRSSSSHSTITKEESPKKSSSIFSRPKSHSPPKTRVGGFGKITRRK